MSEEREKRQKKGLDKEQRALLYLLRSALTKRGRAHPDMDGLSWERLLYIAKAHAVLPLLYDALGACRGNGLSEELFQMAEQVSRITVQSNYRLLFLTKYLTEFLKEQGIYALTLKGAYTAALYPVPELRKSGDVDLLITDSASYEKACRLLERQGFAAVERQISLHHTELRHPEGIAVEIHGMLAEPFANSHVNHYLERLLAEYGAHREENTAWGVSLYGPQEAYHAFYLALHMLQHYLRAGFGLKYLCDWAVFWNRELAEPVRVEFLRLIKESGTEGFVQMLTAACVKYLGLPEKRAAFLGIHAKWLSDEAVGEFMQEVFRAGEFGHAEADRMVAMQGTGIGAFAREFHHQMRLNYPKAAKAILAWPALWILTLARFLRNNRTVRGVSAWEILRKARRRSALVKRMGLFKEGKILSGK